MKDGLIQQVGAPRRCMPSPGISSWPGSSGPCDELPHLLHYRPRRQSVLQHARVDPAVPAAKAKAMAAFKDKQVTMGLRPRICTRPLRRTGHQPVRREGRSGRADRHEIYLNVTVGNYEIVVV